MKFKASILTELNKPLVVDELLIPALDVGQVLVKVHASGICGAQIGEISGAKGPDKWLPHLLGHEGGAEVLEIGPGVTQVKPGDYVVMHWRKGQGIEAKPPRYQWPKYIDGPTVGGGWVTTFNEMAVVSENRLTKISQDIPFAVAALMGCAVTTALGLVNNEAKIKIGESVAVAGCGGVGLNIIQGAALVGANPIIALDICNFKEDQSFAAGATRFTNEIDEVGPVDVFIDCTGDCRVISRAYDLVKPGGRLILVGQPRHGNALNLPYFRNQYCGKTVMDSQGGLTNPNIDIPRYLELFKAGKLSLDQFITHRFTLEQVNEALDMVRSGNAGRVILEMA